MIGMLSNSLLPCHTFVLVMGLPGITSALPFADHWFAKQYFIL
jgi:hypothetical protein